MQIAKRGLLPRSTIATIESGDSSPTVDTLLKVSKALSVTLDELVRKPRPRTLLIRAQNVPKQRKSDGLVIQHKVLPDPIYGMEIDRILLKPNARMRGVPHIRDTREYFNCISGEVRIFCDGEQFSLKRGDVLAFPGDLPHSYQNPGDTVAEGFSVVVLSHI